MFLRTYSLACASCYFRFTNLPTPIELPILIDLPIQMEAFRELDFERQLDIVCDAFESCWQRGQTPDVREYARLVDERYQKRLLRELILVERECVKIWGSHKKSRNGNKSDTVSAASNETNRDLDSGKSPQSELPSHIDRFAILKLLGRGSYGIVYEAEDVEIRRRVALKVAYPTSSEGYSSKAFAREAANASRVEHPSVVRVLDVGEYQGTHFMVSELIEGKCLSTLSAEHELDVRTCAEIVAEIAAGIDAAHQQGVIHRDLKPSNIMLEAISKDYPEAEDEFRLEDYRIRILDFGIAKILDRMTRLTAEGDIVGTPHYMSPEQASGNSYNVDRRSDVFSLGVILFELLAKRLPFDGPGMAVVSGVRDLQAPSLRSVVPDIPVGLAHIVDKCLERKPANRYQSAGALESDLRVWLAGNAPSSLREYKRRKAFWITSVACMACAVLALGFAASRVNWSSNTNSSPTSKIPVANGSLADWGQTKRPQALNAWLERFDEDKISMLAEFAKTKQEFGAIASEDWPFRLAEMCIDKNTSIPSDIEDHVRTQLIESLQSGDELQWAQVFGRLSSPFVDALESRLDTKLTNRKHQQLFDSLTLYYKAKTDLDGYLRLLQKATADELSDIFAVTLGYAADHQSEVLERLRAEIDKISSAIDLSRDQASQWRAKLGLTAYGMQAWDIVEPIIADPANHDARSYFIYWFSHSKLSIESFLVRFPEYEDDWRATAVVSCLLSMPAISREPVRDRLRSVVLHAYANHRSFAVHSGLRKLLLELGESKAVLSVDSTFEAQQISPKRDWYFNSIGMQMNIVRAPVEFLYEMPIEYRRSPKVITLERSFSISDSVISDFQIRNPYERQPFNLKFSPAKVDWYDAVAFCDQLNRNEEIEDRESVYVVGEEEIRFAPSAVGYRLPTAMEWECFFRGGTRHHFCFGEKDSVYYRQTHDDRSRLFLYSPTLNQAIGQPWHEWTVDTVFNRDVDKTDRYPLGIARGGHYGPSKEPSEFHYFVSEPRGQVKGSMTIRICRFIP